MVGTSAKDKATAASTSSKRGRSDGISAHVLFLGEDVRVVATQPGDFSILPEQDLQREAYNAGRRQCWQALTSRPPQGFDVMMSVSAEQIEVVIQQSLVEKLPLLHDFASNTNSTAGVTESGTTKTAELMLPCSVWGIVSLLMLLKACDTLNYERSNIDMDEDQEQMHVQETLNYDQCVNQWFSADGRERDRSIMWQLVSTQPEGLRSQIDNMEAVMQAAEFLGCKLVKQCIEVWLQNSLKDLLASREGDTVKRTPFEEQDDRRVTETELSPAHVWHFTQVLRGLSDRSFTDVCAVLVGPTSGPIMPLQWSNNTALFTGALVKAVHLPKDLLCKWLACAPRTIDLREISLTHVQWTRLAICLSEANLPCTVKTVHWAPASKFDAGNDRNSYIGFGVIVVKEPGVQRDLNPSWQMLCTLSDLVPRMSHLRHLGLHRLHLTRQALIVLGDLLSCLPKSVTALTFSEVKFAPFARDKKDKTEFFRAVALVRNLKELHMPEWESSVGYGEEIACIEPLHSLPCLSIVVPAVSKCDMFPPSLTFRAAR